MKSSESLGCTGRCIVALVAQMGNVGDVGNLKTCQPTGWFENVGIWKYRDMLTVVVYRCAVACVA